MGLLSQAGMDLRFCLATCWLMSFINFSETQLSYLLNWNKRYLCPPSISCRTHSALFLRNCSSPLSRPHNSDKITSHSPYPTYWDGSKRPVWINHIIGSRSVQVTNQILFWDYICGYEKEQLSLPSRVTKCDDASLELPVVMVFTSPPPASSWRSPTTKGERSPHRKVQWAKAERGREREQEWVIHWPNWSPWT